MIVVFALIIIFLELFLSYQY